MAATQTQIDKLRRMIAEPTDTIYDDAALAVIIESFPLYDSDGRDSSSDDWVAAYDLNAAAADTWMEKAAARSDCFDQDADGANLSLSQKVEHAMKMHRHYTARISVGAIKHSIPGTDDIEEEEDE